MNTTIQTGLQPGLYCDIISGKKRGKRCTGSKLRVNIDGTANVLIDDKQDVPVIAIHIESKL